MKDRLITQRIFFFGMVAILAILALILVWQFTRAILLAAALIIILKPVYTWLLNKKGINGRESRATAITILIFILIIAIPAVVILGGAITQAALLFSGLDLEGLDFSLREINIWLEQTIQTIVAGSIPLEEFRFAENLSQVITWFSEWFVSLLIGLGQSLPRLFTNALVVLVILYVFLSRYKSPGKQQILEIVPFPTEITQLFLDKIDLMIKAMFKGTFVIALTQGLAMGFVFWLAGVPYVMFLTTISIFLSLVPLIGISLVAWPVGIILILSGNVVRGVFIIAAFLIFIAQIDTFLRPRLVPKGAQLNPALVILSVLGGLGVLGIVGALYGPVVMILLVTSIDVYSKYLLRSDLEVLEKQGRIDLIELGLKTEDKQADQNMGQMFVTAVKNISARLRRDTPQTETTIDPDTTSGEPMI
jgi:predicted PurR-regulated permease PerM